MFYKLVKMLFFVKGDSISVAFEFISVSFSSSLGCNTRIAPSREVKNIARNKLQNQLDLIYRNSLIVFVLLFNDYSKPHIAFISAINFCANASASSGDFASV